MASGREGKGATLRSTPNKVKARSSGQAKVNCNGVPIKVRICYMALVPVPDEIVEGGPQTLVVPSTSDFLFGRWHVQQQKRS